MPQMKNYQIHFANQDAQNEVDALPPKLQARVIYLISLMEEFGSNLGEPHSKKLSGAAHAGLFELRAKAQEGIARSLFCTAKGKHIYILHTFVKKTDQTPRHALKLALKRKEAL